MPQLFIFDAPHKAFPLRGRWREAPDEEKGCTFWAVATFQLKNAQQLRNKNPSPHQSAFG